jgi:hypothetical protein
MTSAAEYHLATVLGATSWRREDGVADLFSHASPAAASRRS